MTPADEGTVWAAVAIIGAGTLLLRASFLAGVGHRQPPAWAQRILRLVPAAVLAALVTPSVLPSGDAQSSVLANPRLWAGLVAAVVAWRSGKVLLTIAVGMVALWLLQAAGM